MLTIAFEQGRKSASLTAPEGARFVRLEDVIETGSDEVEVLMCYAKWLTEEHLSKFPNLKWVQTNTSGYDGADLEAISRRGLILTNSRTVFADSVAEDAVTKMMLLSRDVPLFAGYQQRGEWRKRPYETREVSGKTLGLVGAGAIGSEIIRLVSGFRMRVLVFRQNPGGTAGADAVFRGSDGLDEMLPQCDYVVLCLPLNADTEGLFDSRRIGLMKKNAFLINVSRGPIVVQEDLMQCLNEGVIAGAAIDVTSPEPLPSDSPLWHTKNLFLTPHQAATGDGVPARLQQLINDNTRAFLEGKPLRNVVLL